MLNTKIALSGLSIIASLALMGGATFALFTDSANQTGNTFAAGTPDLKIAPDVSNSPGTYVDNMSGPNFSGMKPGDVKVFTFWLKNVSDTNVIFNLTADVSSITPDTDATQDIDNALLVKWSCTNPADNELSPRSWFTGGSSNLGTLTQNTQVQCTMTGTLPSSADNSVAGESVSFDVIYGGTQPSPTP